MWRWMVEVVVEVEVEVVVVVEREVAANRTTRAAVPLSCSRPLLVNHGKCKCYTQLHV